MPQDHAQRQLLAIMFTDVVGYTEITERDEASAVRIRETHRDLIQGQVADFDGEVIDATGDESMSIFTSALHAVKCALALQATLRSNPELRIRIGIHLGDVLRSNKEVIGDGVNVAARIRPLAEPGGICVSEPVYQLVRNHLQVDARSLGARSLKHVEQPITVYTLSSPEMAPQARGRRSGRRLGLVAGTVLGVLGLLWLVRTPVLAWAALTAPRLLGSAVEQDIGFAHTRDGVRIAYATSGTGPPLVFVLGWATHLSEGFGSALYDDAGFLKFYGRDRLVVRYDGRGFGLSDRDISDFSLEARVRDIEAVVDTLGLERFALYAFSAGGPAAVAYVARHPERVSQLVLSATYVTRLSDNPSAESMLGSLIQFIESSWHRPTARAALAEFLAPEANDIERRLVMHFLGRSGEGPQFGGFMRAMGSTDVSAQARQIRAPTLVIGSDTDRTVPLAWTRLVAAEIPNARFEIIPNASHIGVSIDDPRVMTLVADFLGRTATSDRENSGPGIGRP